MMSLGYDEVAKICLTHSFNNQTTKEYIGKFDVSDEELNPEYIIPKAFDERVGKTVAAAVAEAARKTGVARI